MFPVKSQKIDSFFVALNFDVTQLSSHSYCKDDPTLYAYSCTVVPHINSTCLHAGWYTGHVKSWYLCREVSGDQLYGRAITGINPFVHYFCVSFFNTGEDGVAKLESYTRDMDGIYPFSITIK